MRLVYDKYNTLTQSTAEYFLMQIKFNNSNSNFFFLFQYITFLYRYINTMKIIL